MTDERPEHDERHDDDRPVYGGRRRRVLRITVLVALAALVLPLVLSVVGQAQSAAARACAVYVDRYDADAVGSRVAFDLFADGGPGWMCSAVSAGGVTTPLANLGLLPSAPRQVDPDEVPA